MSDEVVNGVKKNHLLIRWGYEHPISFFENNFNKRFFGNKRHIEKYHALEISMSKSNVLLTVPDYDAWGREKPSFGGDKPSINIPSDVEYLRKLANAFELIADYYEANNNE